MESPQMYDSGGGGAANVPNGDMKKNGVPNGAQSATTTNNNQPNAVNHNAPMAHLRPRHLPQYHHHNNHHQHPDLEELTGPEISLDLQHLIEDQFRDQEGLALLQEILPGGRASTVPVGVNGAVFAPRTTLAYMPQGVHQGAYEQQQQQQHHPQQDSPPVKEEPQEPHDYRRLGQQQQQQQQQPGGAPMPITTAAAFQSGGVPFAGGGGSYVTNGAGGSFLPPGAAAVPHLAPLKHKGLHGHGGSSSSSSSRRHAGKALDKGTDEYRRRRERNNIAVRKSREKAKVRSREVEERVKCLMREKDALMKRLEAVSGELSVHKQMYVHLMNLNLPEITDLCRSMLNLGGQDHPM